MTNLNGGHKNDHLVPGLGNDSDGDIVIWGINAEKKSILKKSAEFIDAQKSKVRLATHATLLSTAVITWAANAERDLKAEVEKGIEVALLDTNTSVQNVVSNPTETITTNPTLTEKQIREIFMTQWLPHIANEFVFREEDSPELRNSYRVVRIKYKPGQFEESVEKTDLFGWEPFYNPDQATSTDFSQRIEGFAEKMGEAPYELQYEKWEWIQRLAEVAPNDDEAKMLDRYTSRLPEQVKPIVSTLGMTALLWLDRPAENKDQFTTLYRMSSVYSVLAATAPEKVKWAYKLLLPEDQFGKGKWYPFVEPTLANISTVNALLTTKIPQEEVVDYVAIYNRGLEEYRKWVLAEMERDGEPADVIQEESELIPEYYAEIVDPLYNHTDGDSIPSGLVDDIQAMAPEFILASYANLDGAYGVTYRSLKAEIRSDDADKIWEEIDKFGNLVTMKTN